MDFFRRSPSEPQVVIMVDCKAGGCGGSSYCLSFRNDLVLAPKNPRDVQQHFVKEFVPLVKDEEGSPAFALINKATNHVVTFSSGASHPLKLVPFNPASIQDSQLFTEGRNVSDGYRHIHPVNNTGLCVHAFNGQKEHGGVHDGTGVVLWGRAKCDNQIWKIAPLEDEAYATPRVRFAEHTFQIHCKAGADAGEDYSLTIRDNELCLAHTTPRDVHQHWVKDWRHSNQLKDKEGYPAFALVNSATGEAIKHSQGNGHPTVCLVPYNKNVQDVSVLWTEGRGNENFRPLRTVNNIRVTMEAADKDHRGVRDGTPVVLEKFRSRRKQRWFPLGTGRDAVAVDNQLWKILPW